MYKNTPDNPSGYKTNNNNNKQTNKKKTSYSEQHFLKTYNVASFQRMSLKKHMNIISASIFQLAL